MPSSFDHCKVCPFSELTPGNRVTVSAEHMVNMDAIHGRKAGTAGMETLVGSDRKKAALDCARMVVDGECSIYEVHEKDSKLELIEKEA